MSPEVCRQRWWLVVASLLILAIIGGGALLAYKTFTRAKPVEIVLSSSSTDVPVEVYLDSTSGQGIYAFDAETTLGDILRESLAPVEPDQGVRMRIIVLDPGEDPFAPRATERTNINVASQAELETLPGIGPVKAQAIVEYRHSHGLFRTVEELMNVPGIGPATLAAIIDLITVL